MASDDVPLHDVDPLPDDVWHREPANRARQAKQGDPAAGPGAHMGEALRSMKIACAEAIHNRPYLSTGQRQPPPTWTQWWQMLEPFVEEQLHRIKKANAAARAKRETPPED